MTRFEGKLRSAAVLVALASLVFAAGCARTINPKPTGPELSAAHDKGPSVKVEDYTYELAMAYIQTGKSQMREFADYPTEVRNLSGLGAIGSAIGAAASALFDAHQDYIFGFGLAGGTFLAASELYGNPAFEEVYEQGLGALVCIDNKLRPSILAGANIKVSGQAVAEHGAVMRTSMAKIRELRYGAEDAQAALEMRIAAFADEKSLQQATLANLASNLNKARYALKRDYDEFLVADTAYNARKTEAEGASGAVGDLKEQLQAKETELAEASLAVEAAQSSLAEQDTAEGQEAAQYALNEAQGIYNRLVGEVDALKAQQSNAESTELSATANRQTALAVRNKSATKVNELTKVLANVLLAHGSAEGVLKAFTIYEPKLAGSKTKMDKQLTFLNTMFTAAKTGVQNAQAQRQSIADVKSAEARIVADVIASVDNVFIQVRNKIRQVDPGTQGISNAVAFLKGFGANAGNNMLLPQTELDDQPSAEPGGVVAELAGVDNPPRDGVPIGFSRFTDVLNLLVDTKSLPGGDDPVAVVPVPDHPTIQAILVEAPRMDVGAARAQLAQLKETYPLIGVAGFQVPRPEILAFEASQEALEDAIFESRLQTDAVKSVATEEVDVSSCNVPGATIPQFRFKNVPSDANGKNIVQIYLDDTDGAKVYNLTVEGGQPLYAYNIVGGKPEGITISYGGGKSFAVGYTKETKGDLSLEIVDSLKSTLEVVLKFTKPETLAAEPEALGAAADNATLEATLKGGVPPYKIVGDEDNDVRTAKVDGDKLTVTVKQVAKLAELDPIKISDSRPTPVEIEVKVAQKAAPAPAPAPAPAGGAFALTETSFTPTATGEMITVTISGGQTPYALSDDSNTADGLTVTEDLGLSTFTVTVDDFDAMPDTHTFDVTDSAAGTFTFTVTKQQ